MLTFSRKEPMDPRCAPASSGNTSRCHGIVGSTKGRGVRLSMYIGRLMATFDPRRLLIFAVRVLETAWRMNRSLVIMLVSIPVRAEKNHKQRNARKSSMGIGDLLWEKQAVAGDGLGGIVIRYGESSGDPQAREGSERHGNLIPLQFRTSQLPPLGDPLVNPLLPPLK